MTDYIEEMMKTAGVKERPYCFNKYTNDFMPCEQPCEECAFYDMKSPDFTSEMQLEVIKLIGESTDLHYFGGGMSSLSESNDEGVIEVDNPDFTQALAQLTTELLKANELDKEKVKEILEG